MYFKQIDEIVAGTKTCTQRVVKSNEYEHVNEDGEITLVMTVTKEPRQPGSEYNPGRVKWQVGRDYAVSPGRGKLTALVGWWAGRTVYHICRPETREVRDARLAEGYVPLRIRILQIWRVDLHSTHAGIAIAEGVGSVAEYEALWNQINGANAWEANPMVWRLWFEVVK